MYDDVAFGDDDGMASLVSDSMAVTFFDTTCNEQVVDDQGRYSYPLFAGFGKFAGTCDSEGFIDFETEGVPRMPDSIDHFDGNPPSTSFYYRFLDGTSVGFMPADDGDNIFFEPTFATCKCHDCSDVPIESPSGALSDAPTFVPDETQPTYSPTEFSNGPPGGYFLTTAPSEDSTIIGSYLPTSQPIEIPTNPTPSPLSVPTFIPEETTPTFSPTDISNGPPGGYFQTTAPAEYPSIIGSNQPTSQPSNKPANPTPSPISAPTSVPEETPPTYFPTEIPSGGYFLSTAPNEDTTMVPTFVSNYLPSTPSLDPSMGGGENFSDYPTDEPLEYPTSNPVTYKCPPFEQPSGSSMLPTTDPPTEISNHAGIPAATVSPTVFSSTAATATNTLDDDDCDVINVNECIAFGLTHCKTKTDGSICLAPTMAQRYLEERIRYHQQALAKIENSS